MIKIIKKLIEWHKNDPVHHCELYKDEGCSHVDGLLCDFPKCSMLADYIERKKVYDVLCPACRYYCLGNGGIGCIDKPSLLKKWREYK